MWINSSLFVISSPPAPLLQDFQGEAYHASNRADLLKALDAYMEASLALPPSEFSRSTLLPYLRSANEKYKEKEAKKMAAKEAAGEYYFSLI